jgi:hypothetical protein
LYPLPGGGGERKRVQADKKNLLNLLASIAGT